MTIRRKTRVLIVDDSLLFREALARNLAKDPGIEVVATASDPFAARDKIIEFEPDVMTLDIEMPKMNGIEFLKRLMPQYPIPVVVVSAATQNVFDALNAGAVDFVGKPDIALQRNMDTFVNELIIKIKIASTANMSHWKTESAFSNVVTETGPASKFKMIAIGASTGGTEAVFSILQALPTDMPGIVAVLHMPPVFTAMYAERLNKSCALNIKEAQTGDIVKPGHVLIAPGDYHMKLKKIGDNFSVECFKGERVNGHCPSVDVLFQSVAALAGKQSIGVILTGMGYDGAKGLLSMKRAGARTIGQDESSCVVYGMPKVAYELGAIDKQVALKNVPQTIMSILNSKI